MLTSNHKIIIKHFPLVLFFALAISGLFLNLGHCEVKNLVDDLDYYDLTQKEKRSEVALLLKYAKKAYQNNDLETSRSLFNKILELSPEHPAANKYLAYLIPKKIESMESLGNKRQLFLSEKIKKQELKKQKETQRHIEGLDEQIKRTKTSQDAVLIKQLADLARNDRLKQQLKIKKIKDAKTESKRQEALRKKQEGRLKKEKKINEIKEAKIKKKEDLMNKMAKELERQDEILLAKKNKIKKNLDSPQKKREKKKVEREQKLKEKRELREAESKKKIAQKIAKKDLVAIQKKQKLLAKDERIRKKRELMQKKDEELEKELWDSLKNNESIILEKSEMKKEIDLSEKPGPEDVDIQSGKQLPRKEENKLLKKRIKQEKIKESKQKQQELRPKKQQVNPAPRAKERGFTGGGVKEEILRVRKDKLEEAALKKQALLLRRQKDRERQRKIKESDDRQKQPQEKKESQNLEKYKEATRLASQKDKTAQIEALYKEALYCFKIAKFDLAEEAFSKIIELESTQVKARDYVNVYIPEARKKLHSLKEVK